MKLEEVPVAIRFFRPGSVDDVESIEQADRLASAQELIGGRFPEAVYVRCCQQEEDGGCVFVYANSRDQELDEADVRQAAGGATPPEYGRWVGLISSAGGEEPKCSQPSSHL
mgnify:FL=1